MKTHRRYLVYEINRLMFFGMQFALEAAISMKKIFLNVSRMPIIMYEYFFVRNMNQEPSKNQKPLFSCNLHFGQDLTRQVVELVADGLKIQEVGNC